MNLFKVLKSWIHPEKVHLKLKMIQMRYDKYTSNTNCFKLFQA